MRAVSVGLVAVLLLPACQRRSRSRDESSPSASSSVTPRKPPTEDEIELRQLIERLLATIEAGDEDRARTTVAGFKLDDCKEWFESRFQNSALDMQNERINGDDRTVDSLVAECTEQSNGLERTMLEKLRSAIHRGWTTVRVESFSTASDPLATMTQGQALRFARVPVTLYSLRLSEPTRPSPGLHIFSFVRDQEGHTKYVGRMTGATTFFLRGLHAAKFWPPAEGLYWRRNEFWRFADLGIGPDPPDEIL